MDLLLVRTNEIALKHKNKKLFEKQLIRNINSCAGNYFDVKKAWNRIYLIPKDKSYLENELVLKRISDIFGIHSFSPVYVCDESLENIKKISLKIAKNICNNSKKTFKVNVNRANKKFPSTSMKIAADIGEYILDNIDSLNVKLKNPDFSVSVDIRDDGVYIFSESTLALGGLPVGVSSKGTVMLSGGIDSPVATFMMLKRGMILNGINFSSPPYTGIKSEEKVIELASKISYYSIFPFYLYIIPFTKVQLAIREKAETNIGLILQRRSMMRITNNLTKLTKTKCIVTGESLGQVASQTLENLLTINEANESVVLRPLVGFDKQDTITLSKKYGFFETSILPYEDSCTVFVPKKPATKSNLDFVIKNEELIPEIYDLEKEALNNSKKYKIHLGTVEEIDDFKKLYGGVL